MKLDKKKVSETCRTILSSADLDTITEKKVRRQVEEELELEAKILDGDPYKGIIKEIVNKIINDLQQKSESPQVSQVKKTETRAKTSAKLISTNKKSRETKAKSKEPSKNLEANSKPLTSKARSKVSKQESSPISKTQIDKAQNKTSKTNGEVSPTNRGEQSKTTEDILKPDDNISSSSSRPNKNNVTSKSTTETGQSNKFEEKSESVSFTKRATKSSETNNEEKQKPDVSRSRVKRKIKISSDTDDNESDSALVSTAKESDLEGSALPPPKRPKQINFSSNEDDEPSSKRRVKEKPTEKNIKQSRRKIDIVEDGGVMMALENKLLAQNSDIIPALSGDDVESDNTIKDDDRGMLKRTSEPEGKEDSKSQNNSESIGEVKQEPNRLKVEPTSSKRTIDSVEVKDGDSDLSSLEDDKPQNKKRKIREDKLVNDKLVKDELINDKLVNDKSVKHKLVNNKTAVGKDEKNEKTIKNLKSFILKCGVRKNWSKELADCSTDFSKIKKLKKILADLGVEGRATLKKCKEAKKSLELEAELKAMDIDNIISDDIKESRKARASRGIFNPVRRQVARSSPEYDDSSSKDIHSDSE